MDKFIYSATEIMIQPFIDHIREQYETSLQAENVKSGQLGKSQKTIKKEAEEACEELKHFLIGEEEINRIEKGFQIIIGQLDRISNKNQILEEIHQASNKLITAFNDESVPEIELSIYETLQEMYGISDDSFQSFYQIAVQLYQEEKIEEALNAFTFLTTLNSLVFEPWLALGSCWFIKKNWMEALRTYSVAALLNFNHPESHLYSAECYLMIQQEKIGKETLTIALSLMSEEQLKEFNDQIQHLKKEFHLVEGGRL